MLGEVKRVKPLDFSQGRSLLNMSLISGLSAGSALQRKKKGGNLERSLLFYCNRWFFSPLGRVHLILVAWSSVALSFQIADILSLGSNLVLARIIDQAGCKTKNEYNEQKSELKLFPHSILLLLSPLSHDFNFWLGSIVRTAAEYKRVVWLTEDLKDQIRKPIKELFPDFSLFSGHPHVISAISFFSNKIQALLWVFWLRMSYDSFPTPTITRKNVKFFSFQ